ncbi:mitochondrial S-adenosylmethionine transporter [Camillea tinctor]|nr:mitochondrial S-adenosylmethionine transporter [Camillea tinctor]
MSGNSHTNVMLAGAAAAFTVDMLIYPLDTLKTRQQSPRRLPAPQLFRGLYQGVGIVVVATLPAAGVFFTTYEAAKSFVSRNRHLAPISVPQPLVHAAASAVAECASCLVLTPAEVVKQNAQMLRHARGGHESSSLEALRHLRGNGGSARTLLSGYAALVARNLPFTALQFPLFEHARERLWGYYRGGKGRSPGLAETGVVTGVSAGLAGSFAAVVTTPMDVVKTRLMLEAGDVGVGDGRSKGSRGTGSSSLRVVREVLAEQGVPGLFRGAVLRSVWTAVGSGLYLGMYEVAKVWLTRGDGNNEDDGDSFP